MVHIIAKLMIEDYEKWKPIFDERKALRKDAGSKEVTLYRNSENAKELILIFDWENMEKAKGFFTSQALKDVLKKGGAELVETTYLEEIEKAT